MLPALLLSAFIAPPPSPHPGDDSAEPVSTPLDAPRPTWTTGALPLAFEENGGRYRSEARFVVRAGLLTAFLTETGPALVLSEVDGTGERRAVASLRLDFVGGRASSLEGLDELPTLVHHFRGADPARWSSGNRTFGAVRLHDVWSGIDVRFYERDGALEFDFEVAPGADPSAIAVAVRGLTDGEALSLDAGGDLVVPTAGGPLTLPAPVLHEERTSGPQPVDGAYALRDGATFGFTVGPRDPQRPLVIDPLLEWATLLGGSAADSLSDVAEGPDGRIYVSGFSESVDLPTTVGGFQTEHAEEGDGSNGYDAVVGCFSADGATLEWLTYLGGDDSAYTGGQDDYARAIAVDATGVFVAGDTLNVDFPVTPGAFDTVSEFAFQYDGFVTKLPLTGDALTWSSYLGENNREKIFGLALASDGGPVVGGWTKASSNQFPITPGAAQPDSNGDYAGFVTRFAPDGASLVFSTFVGGNSTDRVFDVDVDAMDRVYVAGVTRSTDFPTPNGYATAHSLPSGQNDGFVARLAADGSAFEYGTYLGGSAYEDASNEYGHTRIAVDDGGVWFATHTRSDDYPTTPGAFQEVDPCFAGCQDVAVTRLDTDAAGAASMIWSTYFGASGTHELNDVDVDTDGNAYVIGYTNSSSLPLLDAWQPESAGANDGFLAVFDPTGALLSSTFFGTSTQDGGLQWPGRLDVRPDGEVFLTGFTHSAELATVGAFQTAPAVGTGPTGYVAKFVPGTPTPAAAVVRTACSGAVLSNSIGLEGDDLPKIGATMIVELDATTGLFPTGTPTTLVVSLAPAPGYPCGVPVPGLGPGGSTGELLVSLGGADLVLLTPVELWFGGAADHEVAVPNQPAWVGLPLFGQGVFVGPDGPVLTEALDLVIGV